MSQWWARGTISAGMWRINAFSVANGVREPRVKADTLADAKHMCVHGHGRLAKHYGQDHIGRLAPYSGVSSDRRSTGAALPELLVKSARHPGQRLGLVVGIRHRLYIWIYIVGGGESHRGRVGKRLESAGVTILTRLSVRLGRQYNCNEELEWRTKLQLRRWRGHLGFKAFDNPAISFLDGHQWAAAVNS